MVGRPPEYRPEMCKELVDLMEQGWLDCEVYSKWNISKNTFYRWIRENPEFAEAYQTGLPKCESYMVKKLKEMMTGDLTGKHSFTATISLLNNKFGWAKTTTGDPTNSTNINVNTLNVFNNQDRQETLEFIKDQLVKQNIIELKNDEYQLLESPTESGNKE